MSNQLEFATEFAVRSTPPQPAATDTAATIPPDTKCARCSQPATVRLDDVLTNKGAYYCALDADVVRQRDERARMKVRGQVWGPGPAGQQEEVA
jgi:hypothetical protein